MPKVFSIPSSVKCRPSGNCKAALRRRALIGGYLFWENVEANALMFERFARSRGTKTAFFWLRVLLMAEADVGESLREETMTRESGFCWARMSEALYPRPDVPPVIMMVDT